MMRCVRIVGFLCLLIGGAAYAEPAPAPPDLTQGGTKDDSHDWLLGPTGARGWVFFRHEDLTALSRQILVTAVDAKSPSGGILETNDVILGVNGHLFTDDARKSLAHAITAAEAKTGRLSLLRWRAGRQSTVELKLPVLGAYSETAPYNCPKSQAIFEQGCRFIEKKGLKDADIPVDLNALALLASGRAKYRPMLTEYSKKVAASLHQGTWTWYYGYGNLFLAEYVLATNDRTILPELKRITKEIAVGQSAVGTWGHNFARPDGNLEGYGCMNQPGVILTLSMVLARQAGVKDPVVDRAIDKAVKFLRYYVNKGAIPYGDHQPGGNVHDDNGKTSAAAVLFDLLGDREAAAFYSRMAVAAYDEREHGHCGNYWNMLWAIPGASRCGPLATGAYVKEQSWYYDLARNWKGGFVYQKVEKGEENDNYTEWDLTGAYLLSYALPLKSLYVTGKKPSSVPPLNSNEVKDVIAAGRDFYPVNGKNGYDQRTSTQLLAGLSSWSPALRYRSAQALGRREGNSLSAVLLLLATPDRNARYGAVEALGCLGSRADSAAPQLRALLKDPDPWMESLACNAIARLSPVVRKDSVDDLLALAVRKNANDPRGMVQRSLAASLFSPYPGSDTPTVLNHSLEGVDRRLLYPAIESLLQNEDSVPRGQLAWTYQKLTDRDIAVLLPSIIKAIEKVAPSDEMFADEIRVAGLDLLSRLHIREGMALCVSTIEWRWGNDFQKRLEYLLRYGAHAKEFLPQLRKLRPDSAKEAKIFDEFIGIIETSKDAPTLVSLKDFITKASSSEDSSNNRKKGTL